MGLGRIIHQLRNERRWSQDELAHRIGTTPANISRLERGLHRPRTDLLGSIAYVFGLKVYELIALTEGVKIKSTASQYSADEVALLATFRKMHKEEQILFQSIGESLSRVRRMPRTEYKAAPPPAKTLVKSLR